MCESCKSCGSAKLGEFTAEIGIHFPGLKNIDKPVVWVFPQVLVRLDSGVTEFIIPETQFHRMNEAALEIRSAS
jgi:hypothetical protein